MMEQNYIATYICGYLLGYVYARTYSYSHLQIFCSSSLLYLGIITISICTYIATFTQMYCQVYSLFCI